jgi:DNA-binding CsgD family transcriptional regulator
MRVVIVGSAAARRRMLELIPEGLDVVGQAATIAEARGLGIDAEAFLLAPPESGVFDGDAVEAVEPVESLTPRELDVVELLVQGLSNKSIAARLGISDQTVKFHVASICGKLGAANRTEAAHKALQLGLVPL